MADLNKKASVSVSVNGEEAKKELESLEKIAKGLRKKLGEAYDKNDNKAIKGTTRELKKVETSINRIRKESFDITAVMQRLDKASPKELRKTLSAINRELNSGKIERGSKEWDNYKNKAQAVKNELKLINQEQKEATTLMERFGNGVKGFISSTAGKLFIGAGVGIGLNEIRENYLSVDESYSDVIKYTGLAKEEVLELNKAYKDFNTRTPRQELNRLAGDAGRLGIKMQDVILDFVQVADVINLALGEDLGEDGVKNIGKIAMAFKEVDKLGLRDAMLSTSSAINELGQNSAAAEPYLLDFTARLGGVGVTANVAQTDIMGYGSVLDQNLQSVEMSATAVQQLLLKMPEAPEQFAKVMRVSKEEFTKMFNEDANQTLLKFLDSIHQLGSLDKISPVLKELGLSGVRASGVITALANNTDKIREAQELANEAYKDATSVIEESTIRNNTAQANVEKLTNALKDETLELGEKLIPIQLAATSALIKFIQTIKIVISFFYENRKVIAPLIALLTVYVTIVQAAAIKNKILAGSNHLLAASINIITGNIDKAKYSLLRFYATVKANPFALLLSAITAVGVALYYFSQRVSESVKMSRSLFSELEKERSGLKNLIAEFDKTEKGTKEYNTIKQQLIDKYSTQLTAINLEVDALHRNKQAYQKLTEEIERNAAAKIKQEYIDKASISAAKEIAEHYSAIREKFIKDLGQEKGDANFQILREFWDSSDEHMKDFESYRNTIDYIGKLGVAWKDVSANLVGVSALRGKLRRDLKEIDAVFGVKKDRQVTTTTTSNVTEEVTAPTESNNAEKLKELDKWLAGEKAKEASYYLMGLKNKMQYDDAMLQLEIDYLEKKKALAENGSKEYLELEASLSLKKIEQNKKYTDLDRDQLAQDWEDRKRVVNNNFVEGIISYDSYKQQLLDSELQYLRDSAKTYVIGSKERLKLEQQAEELANKDRLQKMEDFENRKKQLQQQFSKSSLTELHALDMQALEALHAQKLISEKEYLEAKKRLEMEYNQATQDNWLDTVAGEQFLEKTQFAFAQFQALGSAFTNFQNAESDAAVAAVERKYDAEIKAAGNNQYKVKQLEEKKQKEIQAVKAKYADKAMVLQMAMAMAQAIQGSIAAYTSTAAIPIIGPKMAPIAAGIAMAAGMLNVAAIAKQQQAAKKGYAKGGFTDNGRWDEEQGVVHSNEFVANRFAVQNPAVRPFLEFIDTAQRNNTIGRLTTEDIVSNVGYKMPNTSNRQTSPLSSTNDVPATDNDVVTLALISTIDKLNKRLDEPFTTINSVDGEYGIKQALDNYNAQEKNKAR